jgi:cardiolipin synthase A/B
MDAYAHPGAIHRVVVLRDRYSQILETVTGSPFREGNEFALLQNGDEIFPAMLKAIREAQQSIVFLSYVFWRSGITTEFAQAMMERARAGVQVRLLVDAFGGATISARTIWQLERSGVKVGWFRPGRWKHIRQFNHRTHRKILITDGRIGFTGGVGIADIWTGFGQDRRHWREIHCRIEGPAVIDMHAAFAESWLESTGERLSALTAVAPLGDVAVHTTTSTAGVRPTRAEQMVTSVFAAASSRLWITSAYFVPSRGIVQSLAATAGRGVDVRVLTNGRATDHHITRFAGRAVYGPLLEAGVKLYEYQESVHHAKVMTADSAWGTIGSINLDARSLVLNDELNVSVVDPGIVAALEAQFLADLQRAEQITSAGWRLRGRLNRMAEYASSFFANQL